MAETDNSMKKNRRLLMRSVCLILAVVWMRVIFGFSAQPAAVSSDTSEDVSSAVIRIVDLFSSSELTDEQVMARAVRIDHAVRKAAHATEYAVLAFLWLGELSLYDSMHSRKYWVTQLICTAYAATDEFHQLWSAGRSASIKDVCIDSAGACIALLIAWGISKCTISLSDRHRSAEKT